MSPSFTILVADDNPVNLALMATTLRKEGYRIVTANSGKEARHLADTEPPDLILLDIRMPGESGFDVIKHFKSDARTAAIPVIFLTAVTDVKSKIEGFSLGAVDYITKPFHPKEVSARVSLHLKLSIATNSLINSQAEKLRQLTEAQASFLITPEQEPGARFGVHYLALHEAGGDFYDVLHISDDIYGYFIADFSGHDISTGYLTSSVKGLLKQNCTQIYTPMESMNLINGVLVEILPAEKYLTACYARLNRRKGLMDIVFSGHPPVCYVPQKGPPRLVGADGDPMGMFQSALFGLTTLTVSKGDRVYIYTDGLVESPSSKKIWHSETAKMLEACDRARSAPIGRAPRVVSEHLCPNRESQEDDMVILALEI
ncbi:response regulator [Desulfoluna spongiiphila]|uniref:response regulator n=1 Tax=Desulfoluna spongiiphila TaxID=419481 RepID=UPI001255B023|nr:response regulator [Desulfoluna spongiiphila]VVS92702.1 signal transduction response regulator receiver domain [Desulfoluna spongiiphila]